MNPTLSSFIAQARVDDLRRAYGPVDRTGTQRERHARRWHLQRAERPQTSLVRRLIARTAV